MDKLLHGKEKAVHADAGYSGADKRAPKRGRRCYIAAKRGKVKAITDEKLRAFQSVDGAQAIAGSNRVVAPG